MSLRLFDPAPPKPARWPLWSKATDYQSVVLALIILLMIGVFIFDIFTPPDDVSICFVYAVLVSISIFSHRGAAYWCAALGMGLSGLGAFIQMPLEALSPAFFANRTIAVAAQWLVAFLVTTRKDAEAMIRADYEAERLKVETSRRFIDVLSHEIGTSLTTIDGQAFRIKKLAFSGTASDVDSRSEKIRQAVRHIEEVVRQVQIAAEVDQGKIYFEPGEINLANLVAEVVQQSGAEQRISLDTTALPIKMWGSADMLHQAIGNVISNAIKYSLPDTNIAVLGRTEDQFALLSVSDCGRGIPGSEQAKLFEPYYRASNSRGIHGTGIGLFVVQRYIKSHGGAIEISSELGVGTTVTIRIPIGQRDGTRAPAANPLY